MCKPDRSSWKVYAEVLFDGNVHMFISRKGKHMDDCTVNTNDIEQMFNELQFKCKYLNNTIKRSENILDKLGVDY